MITIEPWPSVFVEAIKFYLLVLKSLVQKSWQLGGYYIFNPDFKYLSLKRGKGQFTYWLWSVRAFWLMFSTLPDTLRDGSFWNRSLGCERGEWFFPPKLSGFFAQRVSYTAGDEALPYYAENSAPYLLYDSDGHPRKSGNQFLGTFFWLVKFEIFLKGLVLLHCIMEELAGYLHF